MATKNVAPRRKTNASAIPLLYRGAAATLTLDGQVAIAKFTGTVDAESLPWIATCVVQAGRRLSGSVRTNAFLFDVTAATVDLQPAALNAHAYAERVGTTWEPIAWVVPGPSVDPFRTYAQTAADFGKYRLVFWGRVKCCPLQWIAEQGHIFESMRRSV